MNIPNLWSTNHFARSEVFDWETSVSEKKEIIVKGKGRHDPCVVPRAVPIVESMAANVLVDLYLQSNK